MKIETYLELGLKRTFAGALDWPGWSRSGRDEASALQALLDYGPRYAAAIRATRLRFEWPGNLSALVVIERLKGDSTTNFGAPGRIPAGDGIPVDEAELRRLQSILKASWRTFDEVIGEATGKTLRAGPRGGGRDRQKIIEHVLGAEQAYLSRLGVKLQVLKATPLDQQLNQCRNATLKAVAASANGELPERGPRGGQYWPARYFVRRAAWHVLDHAWEIEDRLE
jgi:hypothetical protein